MTFCSLSALAESDLEEMAMHETEDSKVFQRFKRKIATEPHQVENGRAKKIQTVVFFCPYLTVFVISR